MFIGKFIFFSGCLSVLTDAPKGDTPVDSLKINQIQMLGSHNSYRKKTYEPLWNELHRFRHPFSKSFIVQPWNYGHQPLDSQLSVYGMRNLELDLYHDPQGGRFYSRLGNKKIGEETASGIEALKKPGMKVMHVPDYDYETHHYLFTDALQTIKKWSDEHQDHEPLFLFIELKELQFMKYLFPRYCSEVLPFTKAAVDSVDQEIESVFGKESEQVLTPDEVRGNFATLNEAILNKGWPTLKECRGKVFFILMAGEEARKNYLDGHESLKGRTMFILAEEGKPETAFIKVDNPVGEERKIQELVKKGYMVRTRSDANTKDARKEKYKRFQAALESGAQIISTDYYAGVHYFKRKNENTDFKIELPGENIFRVSPVFNR